MALIEISNLSFCYDGSHEPVFQNVSLHLDTSWKLGLIGRNGRGKTTLLRLLRGQLEYEGHINSPLSFDCFPVDNIDPGESGWRLLERAAANVEKWRLMRELSIFKLDPSLLYRPCGSLSGGERTRIMLAGMSARENGFLLIDEPTNHLDLEARKIVSTALRRSSSGFILVSHDRALLDGCIDHVLSINRGDIELQRGNYSSWKINRDLMDESELNENERLRREIKRLELTARRSAEWSDKTEKGKRANTRAQGTSGLRPDRGFVGHKAAKMMKRAKSLENRQQSAIEEKSSLLKNLEETEPLIIRTLSYPKRTLLQARELSVSIDGKRINSPVTFTIDRGERLALTGGNGCGKTTLLRLLSGKSLCYDGELHRGSNLVISTVAQDTSGLSGSLRTLAEKSQLDVSLFFAILRKLGFSRAIFEQELSRMSEGQKKKVLIAQSLCRPAHLYLWDEPLNFVDLPSREQLELLLLEHSPTILFVEHDAAFLKKIATRTIELSAF